MIDIAIEAATSASKILLDNFGKISVEDIKEKNKNDFLTFVDEQSENRIIKIILQAFPDHSILAEESGWKKHDSDYEWNDWDEWEEYYYDRRMMKEEGTAKGSYSAP